MKKKLCLLGIIALAVVITFSMTSCPDLTAFLNNNPNDNSGNNPGDNHGNNPGDNPGNNPGDNPGNNPGDNPGNNPDDNPGNNPGDNPGDNPNNNEPGNGNNNNGEPGNGDNNINEPTIDKLTSVNDVSNFLNKQTGGNTIDDPVVLSIEMYLGYMTSNTSNWQKLLEIIDTAGKYVELDLYFCTMLDYYFVYNFNPDYRIKTGKDKIVSIILPYEADTITDANNNAFRHFTNLKSVSGRFLTEIGDFAFYNCSSLTEANFPQTTTIYPSAFRNCASLTEINFPKARIIGDDAFNGNGLVSADFPEVTEIHQSAFKDCANLTEINSPKARVIGDNAFNSSGLASAEFPEVTTIFPSAFSNCTNLIDVDFPKTQIIGNDAFKNSGIVSADFPEVTVINPSAFQDCASLTEVSFEKATIIGNDAFINCTSLRIARFHANPARTTSGNPLQRWVDGTGNFTEDSLVFYPNAFKGCVSLETLDVRNAWNVYFAGGALADIGEHLELYLFDDDGTKSYGHPQNDVFFSNTFKTLTIKAPVVLPPENSQIEKHYARQQGDSDQYIAINTGIVHVLRGRDITVNVERVPALY
jgi:hypothetical protein